MEITWYKLRNAVPSTTRYVQLGQGSLIQVLKAHHVPNCYITDETITWCISKFMSWFRLMIFLRFNSISVYWILWINFTINIRKGKSLKFCGHIIMMIWMVSQLELIIMEEIKVYCIELFTFMKFQFTFNIFILYKGHKKWNSSVHQNMMTLVSWYQTILNFRSPSFSNQFLFRNIFWLLSLLYLILFFSFNLGARINEPTTTPSGPITKPTPLYFPYQTQLNTERTVHLRWNFEDGHIILQVWNIQMHFFNFL